MEKSRVAVVFLGVLAVIAAGAVLKQAQAVVLPLIVAWLLSYVLGPPVRWLKRKRVPSGIAVSLMMAVVLGVLYLVALFLNARVAAFVAAYPRYEEQLAGLAGTAAEKLRMSSEYFAGVRWGEKVGAYLVRVSGSFVAVVSNIVMVTIFLFFLLLGEPFVEDKIRAAFSPERAERVNAVLDAISLQIARYLTIQFLISLGTGFLVWAALRLLRVDFPATWGALAFFLNFVPTVGSIVASIPPILVALVQYYPSFWPCVFTLLALLTIQTLTGNVLSPKVMGDRLNLSPVVVLLSLVFFGWLWGVVGAVLSVPIASAIKIVCENVEPLRPISVFMGSGRSYAAKKRKDGEHCA